MSSVDGVGVLKLRIKFITCFERNPMKYSEAADRIVSETTIVTVYYILQCSIRWISSSVLFCFFSNAPLIRILGEGRVVGKILTKPSRQHANDPQFRADTDEQCRASIAVFARLAMLDPTLPFDSIHSWFPHRGF